MYNWTTFQSKWKEFSELVKNLPTDKPEIDKLQKQVDYIDRYLACVDIDINLQTNIDTFVISTINKRADNHSNKLIIDGAILNCKTYNPSNALAPEINIFVNSILTNLKNLLIILPDGKTDITIDQIIQNHKKTYDEKIEKYDQLNQQVENTTKKIQSDGEKQREIFAENTKNQASEHDGLTKRIESLLTGATTVGLAKAYTTQKKSYEDATDWFNISFFIVILILILFGAFNVAYVTKITNITIKDGILHILFSLPITLPLIWMALYVSKRRSENERLKQEYAHKESLAKSYLGFKKQCEELEGDNKELSSKLLDATITAIAYNPSSTLEKNHDDDMPISKLTKPLKNVTKLISTVTDAIKNTKDDK